MTQLKQDQVVLHNGEPKICIQKTLRGEYRWVTSKTGVMTHSLLSEAIKMVESSNYAYYVNETPKNYNED